MPSGNHIPQIDGVLDWFSTFAALVAAFPSPAIPVGTIAYTTDLGQVRWNGLVWAMNTYVDGLTAHAGGGQGSATALTAEINRITTVTTTGDSVVLPASAPGMALTVINAGANSCNVFPSSGGTGTEKINALAANTAFAFASTKTAEFVCCTAGQWHTVPVVP